MGVEEFRMSYHRPKDISQEGRPPEGGAALCLNRILEEGRVCDAYCQCTYSPSGTTSSSGSTSGSGSGSTGAITGNAPILSRITSCPFA